jgi:hypothetical protein
MVKLKSEKSGVPNKEDIIMKIYLQKAWNWIKEASKKVWSWLKSAYKKISDWFIKNKKK